jgi:hypothetical protein
MGGVLYAVLVLFGGGLGFVLVLLALDWLAGRLHRWWARRRSLWY